MAPHLVTEPIGALVRRLVRLTINSHPIATVNPVDKIQAGAETAPYRSSTTAPTNQACRPLKPAVRGVRCSGYISVASRRICHT